MPLKPAFYGKTIAVALAMLGVLAAANPVAAGGPLWPEGSIAAVPADAVRAAADSAASPVADTAWVAPEDTASASGSDSVRAARPDTAFAPPEGGVWTMDELKSILGGETAGFAGKEYRQRRSGRVAMLCALTFPGLGQMYNEKPLKAAIGMGVETFYTLMIYQNRRLWSREKAVRDTYPVSSSEWRFHDSWVTEYWDRSVDWIWWSAAAVLVIVIDAYVDAHLDDMRFQVAPAASADRVGLQIVLRY